MLNRSPHESYSKRAYNGIYVGWGQRSCRRLGVTAYRRLFAVLNRTRPRRRPRPRNRLAAAFSIYPWPSYSELDNLGVPSTPLKIEDEDDDEDDWRQGRS
jgi:hypothetical protein